MADPALGELPKIADYEPKPNPPAVSIARGIAVALAQLGGNPEQAAVLARQFQNVDEAKQESARVRFQADLARAQEVRLRQSAAAEQAATAESQRISQEHLTIAQAAEARAAAREPFEIEQAKLRAEREAEALKLQKIQVGQAAEEQAMQRAQLFDKAVTEVRQDISEYLSTSSAEIRTSDLLNPATLMMSQSAATPEERMAGMARAIQEAQGAKLLAAFPGTPPAQSAEKIAKIVQSRAEALRIVSPELGAKLVSQLAFLTPDSTPSKIAASKPLTKEEWGAFALGFSTQLSEAAVSGSQLDPAEAELLGRTLKLQVDSGMDPKILLDGLDAMVEKATAEAIGELGVPPEENTGVANMIAMAFRNAIEKGEVLSMSAPIVLRGVGDPDRAALAQTTGELNRQANTLRLTLAQHPGDVATARQLADVERQLAEIPKKLGERQRARKEQRAAQARAFPKF